MIATSLREQPLRAMDVGAAGGVPEHWREYLPWMEIDCFEPDAGECAARRRSAPPNVHWFAVALAGASGTRPFHVLNRATGSSLYPPNDTVLVEYSGRSYAGVRKVIDLECLSLRDFLARYDRPVPALMKLDTQGSELEILSSFDAAQLQQVLCVEVEVEFLELYLGQPTFTDVHGFMTAAGFRLLDLRTHRAYRNRDDQPLHFLRRHLNTTAGSSALAAELVAGDALYIRELRISPEEMSRETLIRYLCILRMYRFFDLCFWLIDAAARAGVIGRGDAAGLASDVAHGAPRPRLHQRRGLVGEVAARWRRAFGIGDYEAFWTVRGWPDQ